MPKRRAAPPTPTTTPIIVLRAEVDRPEVEELLPLLLKLGSAVEPAGTVAVGVTTVVRTEARVLPPAAVMMTMVVSVVGAR